MLDDERISSTAVTPSTTRATSRSIRPADRSRWTIRLTISASPIPTRIAVAIGVQAITPTTITNASTPPRIRSPIKRVVTSVRGGRAAGDDRRPDDT
jgi:hypothetical protein